LSIRTCLPKPQRRQVESCRGLPQKSKLESLNSGIIGLKRNLIDGFDNLECRLACGVGRAPACREKTDKVLSQFADRDYQQSIMRMIMKGRQRNPTSIVSPVISRNDRSAGQNP
jgi:hypothetical protein